jgi:hypothetical protein
MEGGIFLCHWYFLSKSYLQRRKIRNVGGDMEKANTQNTDGQEVDIQVKEALKLDTEFGLPTSA